MRNRAMDNYKQMMRRMAFVLLFLFFVLVIQAGLPLVHAAVKDKSTPFPDRPLTVAVTVDPPYSMKDSEGKWTGLVVELWTLAAQELGRPFIFQEMSFEQVFRMLEDGSIDISIATLYVTADREAKYDLTTPLGTSRFAVATLSKAKDHPGWDVVNIFLSWGNLSIFLALFAVLMVLGGLFWLIERKHNPDDFGEGKLKGIGAGAYWVGSTLTSGVCLGVQLKTAAGRILGLAWMAFCAIALSALIASLTAALSEKRMETRKLAVKDLKQMHLGTERGTLEETMLKETGGRYSLFDSEQAFMKALLAKKIDGALSDEITLHYFEEQLYRGAISVYPTDLKRRAFALAMPKDSSLRRPVNVALVKIMDDPVWDAILERYGFKKNFEARSAVAGKRGKHLSKGAE